MTPEQEKLVIDHIGVADSEAYKFWKTAPQAIELDEIKAQSYMGLVTAAVRWNRYCEEHEYDPTRLEYFQPFAQRRCRGAILDSLRAQDWAPRSLRTRAKQLQNAGQDFGISNAELADRTGMSLSEVEATLAALPRKPISLDSDSVIDCESDISVENSAFESEVAEALVAVVTSLPLIHQAVLALHYMMGRELQHIALDLGITESRASHIHTESVIIVYEALKAKVSEG